MSTFEAFYLTRSTSKLNEAVGQAFKMTPGATEGTNVARTVVNELDTARFDPLLVRAVAKNAAASLEMFLQRADNMVRAARSQVMGIRLCRHGYLISGLVPSLTLPPSYNSIRYLLPSLFNLPAPLPFAAAANLIDLPEPPEHTC